MKPTTVSIPAAPDSNDSPNVGDYRSDSEKAGVTITTKHFVFQSGPDSGFSIEVINDLFDQDNYLWGSTRNNLPLRDGTLVDEITWQ